MKWLFSYLSRRELLGKPYQRDHPDSGTITQSDIRDIISNLQTEARSLIRAADLKRLKSRGNRLNATLGLYHVAMYRSLRKQGLADDYAIELARAIGWLAYAKATRFLYLLVFPFVRDKQKQLNAVLRLLMIFPFNQDPEGYQVKAWKEADHMRTDWTQCVVLESIKRSGDEADLNFFRNSWCQYDFQFPGLISKDGHYEREHTLSFGDQVCDMKWYAKKGDEKPSR